MEVDKVVFETALKQVKSTSLGFMPEDRLVKLFFGKENFALTLQTTNSYAEKSGEAVGTDPFECFCDSILLSKAIASISGSEITFTKKESVLHLKSGGQKFKISTVEHTHKPIKIEFKDEVQVNIATLNSVLSQITPYCNSDSPILSIQGIFFGEKYTFVNGVSRLAARIGNVFTKKFFILSNFARFISNLDENDEVFASFSDNFIKISSKTMNFMFEINTSLEHPPLDKLIEPKPQFGFNIQKSDLMSVAKSIAVVNPEYLVFSTGEKSLTITGTDGSSEFTEALEISSKTKTDIKINASMLKDAFALSAKNCKDEGVEARIFGPKSPLVLNIGEFYQVLSTKKDE